MSWCFIQCIGQERANVACPVHCVWCTCLLDSAAGERHFLLDESYMVLGNTCYRLSSESNNVKSGKKCLLATCLIVHMYCIYRLLFYKLQFRQFTMFSVGYPLILVAIITTDVSSRIRGCWKVTERLNCVIINYTRR